MPHEQILLGLRMQAELEIVTYAADKNPASRERAGGGCP